MPHKYLTKSLFKVGLECPRKLYYYAHPEIYQNKKVDDPFLAALADGGFQVGALAKMYHPEGIDLSAYSTTDALDKTTQLLNNPNVTLFEAAFNFGDLLVRVDILEKVGNVIYLYEVKSKSYDVFNDSFFTKSSTKTILAKWEPYLYDLAFQTYVCRMSMPNIQVKPFLFLANTNSLATIDGLNQKFVLSKVDGQIKLFIKPGTDYTNVGEKILIEVDASEAVELIINDPQITAAKSNENDQLSFQQKVVMFVDGVKSDVKLPARLDEKCKKCEFRCNAAAPLKSGFQECWNNNSSDQYIFDVWDFRNTSDVVASGRTLMKELLQNDFKPSKSNDKNGLSRSERQWLQISMANKEDVYLDEVCLKVEINNWQYPLHFIDFETSRVAVPFNSGRRPYEQIAFQFSHHIIHDDDTVEHFGQYINVEPGIFPNFDFVRALKSQLENDTGTIFRYATHENTVLCDILDQLEASDEPDKDSLINWIKTITTKKDKWSGPRTMVDLCDLVKKYYYHPKMGGSNGLKAVLPAIISDSTYLQNKYARTTYGSLSGIKSFNFQNHSWIHINEVGAIKDPYQLLPRLFDEFDSALDTVFDGDEIKDGGAAMTAYSKLQYTEMSDQERKEIRDALLQYCELDTLAMVLLYEYLSDSSAVKSTAALGKNQ